MFCDKERHKDGLPMQLIMLIAARFFCGFPTVFDAYFIDVSEINESKYGCLSELSVARLNIMYLLNISLDLTTNLTPGYYLNSDAIKSTDAYRYYPLLIMFLFKKSSNYFCTLNVT